MTNTNSESRTSFAAAFWERWRGYKLPFIATLLDQMKGTPVYSSNYNREIAGNKALDELTYDRVLGSVFSELDKE